MNAVPFKIGKQESADSADIGGPRERRESTRWMGKVHGRAADIAVPEVASTLT
jgi:hypothetical protein